MSKRGWFLKKNSKLVTFSLKILNPVFFTEISVLLLYSQVLLEKDFKLNVELQICIEETFLNGEIRKAYTKIAVSQNEFDLCFELPI